MTSFLISFKAQPGHFHCLLALGHITVDHILWLLSYQEVFDASVYPSINKKKSLKKVLVWPKKVWSVCFCLYFLDGSTV